MLASKYPTLSSLKLPIAMILVGAILTVAAVIAAPSESSEYVATADTVWTVPPTDQPPVQAPVTTTTTAPPPPPTTTTTAPPTPTTTHTHAPPPEPVAAASASGLGDPNNPATWDALAQCESGGNWALNTGNGYYGGIQFSLGTWHAVGGSGYPHEASREEQINRGKILQASSGWGQWPGCTRHLGWR